ncbi:MAG: hypothetical protein QG636_478 [Patescibacteria group bacterium]|jgi:hypothetical protein|nr:hypothetical protein [Patescibacteria group bacterium]
MAKSITPSVLAAAKENAQNLLQSLHAGDKTSVRIVRLEKDLKLGFTAEQLGLTAHELGLIARHA